MSTKNAAFYARQARDPTHLEARKQRSSSKARARHAQHVEAEDTLAGQRVLQDSASSFGALQHLEDPSTGLLTAQSEQATLYVLHAVILHVFGSFTAFRYAMRHADMTVEFGLNYPVQPQEGSKKRPLMSVICDYARTNTRFVQTLFKAVQGTVSSPADAQYEAGPDLQEYLNDTLSEVNRLIANHYHVNVAQITAEGKLRLLQKTFDSTPRSNAGKRRYLATMQQRFVSAYLAQDLFSKEQAVNAALDKLPTEVQQLYKSNQKVKQYFDNLHALLHLHSTEGIAAAGAKAGGSGAAAGAQNAEY